MEASSAEYPTRKLWATNHGDGITFTCVEAPLDCGIFEPTCQATTLPGPGETDIETLNAVIHKVDRPLLPPPVLLALYRAHIQPYEDGPRLGRGDPIPSCDFLNSNSAASLPFNLGAPFFE